MSACSPVVKQCVGESVDNSSPRCYGIAESPRFSGSATTAATVTPPSCSSSPSTSKVVRVPVLRVAASTGVVAYPPTNSSARESRTNARNFYSPRDCMSARSRTDEGAPRQTILEKHKSFAHDYCPSHTQDASLKRLAIELKDGGEVDENRKMLSRASCGNLVIGIFKKQNDLSETDLIIDEINGHLKVIDPDGKLGLAKLPTLSGYLYKHQQNRKLEILAWNRRFVILHEGMLYWFHSKADFTKFGVEGLTGGINLVLHKMSVDIVESNRNHFCIATAGGAQRFIFDCSGSQHDRGVWIVSILAHINKSEEIRSRFKGVDWNSIEVEALGNGGKFWKTSKSCRKGGKGRASVSLSSIASFV